MSECPFCSDPRIRESAQGNRFRCGTVGPDINGEYSTGHVCDIAMYNRLLAERNSEIERLDAENDRLIEAIRGVIRGGWTVTGLQETIGEI